MERPDRSRAATAGLLRLRRPFRPRHGRFPGRQAVRSGGSKLTLWTVGQSQPDVDLVARYTDESEVERPLLSVGISPDGQWLAAGDKRGKLRVWKLADQSEAYMIAAHEGRLTELAISPDSKAVATTSYSGEVRVWQMADGKKLKSLKVDKQEISALAFLSETRLATAGREVAIWTSRAARNDHGVDRPRRQSSPRPVARPQELLYTDSEGRTQAWDVENAKGAGPALSGAGASLVEFSTDGKRIATYDSNATIRLWNAASRTVTQVIDADGDRTSAIQWLPESGALLVASESGRVRLWGLPRQRRHWRSHRQLRRNCEKRGRRRNGRTRRPCSNR